MKKILLFVIVCLMFGSIAFAQDPGLRDSIIVQGFPIDTMWTGYVSVRIWVLTDDSVAFYNLPLTWHSIDNTVYPVPGTQYFPPVNTWSEHYDSILVPEHYIRQFGICELDTVTHWVLNTNHQRINTWTLHFFLAPGAPPQTVTIDTVTDDRLGPLLFGLADGVTEFTPEFHFVPPYIGVDENGDAIPSEYALNQNYPNPFNPETNIEFSIPKESDVSLIVYNLLGQRIRSLVNDRVAAGIHAVHWDGKDESGIPVSSGVYFYRLTAAEFVQTNRMTLIR